MRNIDRIGLELAFKFETGYYRENVPAKDYVEWLEEKLSMLFQEKHTTRLSNPITPILKVEETE